MIDLDALEAMEKAATKGPCFVECDSWEAEDVDPMFEKFRCPDENENVWTISYEQGYTGWQNDSNCEGYGLSKKDAELFVALRNAAPEMIEELRFLRHACESWKAEEAENHAEIERLFSENARLLASPDGELAELRLWKHNVEPEIYRLTKANSELADEIDRLRALVAEAWDASRGVISPTFGALPVKKQREWVDARVRWLAEKGVR